MSRYHDGLNCPECGSEDIDKIDSGTDYTTGEQYDRVVCWSCDHDWHIVTGNIYEEGAEDERDDR